MCGGGGENIVERFANSAVHVCGGNIVKRLANSELYSVHVWGEYCKKIC